MGSAAYIVGAGKVFAIPPSTATDPSPFQFLEVPEITLDVKQDTKDVYGEDQDALITFNTRRTISGKLKQPFIQASALARVLQSTLVQGGKVLHVDESTGAISGATYTVQHPTGFELLTVKDDNGDTMTKVTTVTAAGQYSVTSGGVFTFHTSANGKTFLVSYAETNSTGWKLPIDSKAMGLTPQFKLIFGGQTVDAIDYVAEFNSVTFPGLNLPFKAEDTVMPDIDFKVFRKFGTTNIGNLYLGQKL